MQSTTTQAASSVGVPAAAGAGSLRSIGAKAIMAVTGAGLTLFVIAHMVGNLQIFLGQEAINAYAAKLKGMPELLWMARIGLLLLFVTHILLGCLLWKGNREARPTPYVYQATRKASVASRTMIFSGLLLLAFVLFHLAHFTMGWVQPEYYDHKDSLGRPDVYGMMIMGFRVWWVALAYVISMLLLGLHLSHGISSLFQSLGVNHSRYTPMIQKGGFWLAMILMAGNIAMPVAVLLGFVR